MELLEGVALPYVAKAKETGRMNTATMYLLRHLAGVKIAVSKRTKCLIMNFEDFCKEDYSEKVKTSRWNATKFNNKMVSGP